MAKKKFKFLNFIAWLTGVIVSLAVGFAMVDGTLTVPIWLGGNIISIIAGWIVIVTTLLSVILAIIDFFSK